MDPSLGINFLPHLMSTVEPDDVVEDKGEKEADQHGIIVTHEDRDRPGKGKEEDGKHNQFENGICLLAMGVDNLLGASFEHKLLEFLLHNHKSHEREGKNSHSCNQGTEYQV